MDVAELLFLRGENALLQLRIDRVELHIGSHPTNDLVVPDSSIPEVAAVLIDRGGRRYRLRDLTGGQLRLNGQPLEGEEADIQSGDAIQLGDYQLQLRIRAPMSPAQSGERTSVMGQEVGASAAAQLVYGDKSFPIVPDQPFNIGGDEDNDLVLDDQFVSSFHCRLSNEDGKWFLNDLDSTNGTKVNGLKIREAELPLPAQIKIGKVELSFETISESPEPTEPEIFDSFHGMIGRSASMQQVFKLITRFADAAEPVLVIGESGSGKELVSRAMHDASSRASGPYLALNCGALTHTLIESELFGHMRGSFTGATTDKKGAFEAAHKGTLFLDEIGELPLDLQPKLLRVLEQKAIRRVGGHQEIPINTRIVAATHRNLEQLVEEGKFREDLFHRLFVLSVSIPPLQERPEDILLLARSFLEAQAPRPMTLSADAERTLQDYEWPGNIRELRNAIVRAILMTDGDQICASDLQFSKNAFSTRSKDARQTVRRQDEDERQKMLNALDEANGNRAEAARKLGLSKSTFHDRLKRYGIPPKFKK